MPAEDPMNHLEQTGRINRSRRLSYHVAPMMLCIALLVSGGCMVGPDYETPTVAVPEAWLEARDQQVQTDQTVQIDWWKSFSDPVLDALIEDAYRQNLSLRAAAVRVMQAMAQRGIAVGQLFPQTQQIGGAYDREKFSEHPPEPSRYATAWSVGFDAAWELDIWGKFRRQIESADAELDASLASYDNVMVSLVSEVAITYITIRTLQVRVAIAEDNVRIQEDSLRIAESRFRLGATSELDVAQAQSSLEQTRALVPNLHAQLQQAMYQLSFLLGSPPMDLMERLGETKQVPTAPGEIAVGIPAELLRRRPDIRLAERQAAAQPIVRDIPPHDPQAGARSPPLALAGWWRPACSADPDGAMIAHSGPASARRSCPFDSDS